MGYLEVENVRISDTCGVLTPGSTRRLVEYFVSGGFVVEFHSHNDLGQAATNGLIAALSGASYIDTTLMGVGERAGNASLLDFVSLVEKTSSLSTPVTSAQAEEIEGTFREFLSRDEYVETLKISPDSDITQWISQHASH